MTANINSGGQNRVPLYDNLKAIGIVLVILGHVTENHALHGVIYAFHMPLFFFISGMLYKQRDRYAIKLARSILWPYFVFAILSFAYWTIVEIRIRPVPADTSILEQLTNIFYPINMGKNSHIMNVVLWFLPALYLCSIAYHYLLRRIGGTKAQLTAAMIIAIILQCFNIQLPLCIPQALGALPFFVLGHMLNGKIRNFENAATKKKYIVYSMTIVIFILLWIYSQGGEMRLMSYPMGYIPYLAVATCCIMAISMTCPGKHIKALSFLGCNSLAIMLTHEPLKRIVIKVYSVVTSIDMDIARESVFHSIVITCIVILVLCPVIIFLRKYCGFLLRV